MAKKRTISRRDFIRLTASGGAGLAAGRYLFHIGNAEAAEFRKVGDVNPSIPNTRVVYVNDPGMTTGSVIGDWAGQNEATDWDLVGQNMDRMVCMLSKEKSPKNAWEKALVKPADKNWKDVVVAIKTNNIAEQHTRGAVMAKICNVLVNGFGIPGKNVHIYDGCHGGDINRKTPFEKLPNDVRIEGNWGGINTEAFVPEPFGSKVKCVGPLASDEVDILINIAMCKAHSGTFGGFTMTAKNHFGTFSPGPGHGKNGFDFLMGISKSEAILGKIDDKTGKIVRPRQQLCIVDALWASKPGPGGPPTHCTNHLFMGTFSPILDYIVATNFRQDTMKWSINDGTIERFLSDFGYSKKDLPDGGKMISAK